MTADQLEQLREWARRPEKDCKTVRFTCKGGEVVQGILLFVSDAERDVILRLPSSNDSALINWDDIQDFQELT
jgi:hypothetical protein